MIVERQIDIFTSNMQTITNPVNTVGVMGKGLAKVFKERYPDLNEAYVNACNNKVFDVEGLFVYPSKDYRILCFPTKRDWKDSSKLEYIDEGLRNLSLHYAWYGITSISIPAIGCGLGGLIWSDVRSLIYHYFEQHPLEVEVIPFK